MSEDRIVPSLGCRARLYIGDDHGDNTATMKCQLEPGHAGLHRERYVVGVTGGAVIVEWDIDERCTVNDCERAWTCPTCEVCFDHDDCEEGRRAKAAYEEFMRRVERKVKKDRDT